MGMGIDRSGWWVLVGFEGKVMVVMILGMWTFYTSIRL